MKYAPFILVLLASLASLTGCLENDSKCDAERFPSVKKRDVIHKSGGNELNLTQSINDALDEYAPKIGIIVSDFNNDSTGFRCQLAYKGRRFGRTHKITKPPKEGARAVTTYSLVPMTFYINIDYSEGEGKIPAIEARAFKQFVATLDVLDEQLDNIVADELIQNCPVNTLSCNNVEVIINIQLDGTPSLGWILNANKSSISCQIYPLPSDARIDSTTYDARYCYSASSISFNNGTLALW
ncbi:MAG: hypothetical protein LBH34_01460 [Prevotellaceae bacterium]|jgi:hypothetical protein|nr:hypothetical protein [Prevotellaceae bacterium]